MSYALTLLKAHRQRIVADVGCSGWSLASVCQNQDHDYLGIDREEPPGRPALATFCKMNGHHLAVADDRAHITIASHVIEHLIDPVGFAVELARITRPGGLVFIEAPSELSAMKPSVDDVETHSFESFWDDPSHIRPFTPGALYRLALSVGAIPEAIGRGMAGSIPVSLLLARVPFPGSIGSRYVSLKDVDIGLASAYQAIWPERELPPDIKSFAQTLQAQRHWLGGSNGE